LKIAGGGGAPCNNRKKEMQRMQVSMMQVGKRKCKEGALMQASRNAQQSAVQTSRGGFDLA